MMLAGLLHDFRDAARALRKRPVFTVVVVTTLGIGIGANTAIFSVVNSVLLRPLNYPSSQRLYVIHEIIPQWAKFAPTLEANLPDFLIWRKESKSFEDIAISESVSMVLTGSGETEEVRGTRASANFLELLGVHPELGRSLLPEEDQSGRGQVVVLTYSFWRSRFHADPTVVGRSITLDGAAYTIAGVLPQSFHLPGSMNGFAYGTQFFTPLNGPKFYEQDLIGEFDFTAIGRLKAGITPEQAVSELNVIQSRIRQEAHTSLDLRADISSLQSEMVGPARRGLVLLLAAVGAVLLMICVNLANLLLARVPGRMREAGIRKALGASAPRLMQQMLVESLLLALLGGSLGILLAFFGVRALVHIAPADVPRVGEISIDGVALGFGLLASILTAALFGALPAWLVSRADLRETLGAVGKSMTEGRRTRHMRGLLVGLEVATCTMLLVVAGLLGRSLLRLLNLDPGFNVEHVLAAEITLPRAAYENPSVREDFYSRTLEGIGHLPDVRSAAWIHILPLEGQGSVSGINLPGSQQLPPQQQPMANYRAISPDYFQAMGIPLLAGRAFNDHDRGKKQVIVSQNLAQKLWPNENPVGRQCLAHWGKLELSEVIGVVGDVHTRLDRPPLNMVYVADSYGQLAPGAPSSAAIVVRAGKNPANLISAVRNVIHQIGPGVPIVALRPMSQLVSLNIEGRQFQLSLATAFAISALLLAALGIFGVVAYSVAQRQQEFGIRTALGAQHSHLLRMVMWQGLSPVVLGLAVGIFASVLSGSLLQSLIFGVRSSDLVTIASVALLVAFVAALACYIPARRALSADPIVALRYE